MKLIYHLQINLKILKDIIIINNNYLKRKEPSFDKILSILLDFNIS